MPRSANYCEYYAHLHSRFAKKPQKAWQEEDYFLVVLTAAPHLDYTETEKFFQSVAKHPSNCSKNGDVGHVWIYLQGKIDGDIINLEGGHSGEIDTAEPKYCEAVMTASENISELNPVKYLWAERRDGFFQKGSGGHTPSYAAKIKLSENEFFQILAFIQPECYDYRSYALTGKQCCFFAVQVAALAGVDLEEKVCLKLAQNFYFRGDLVRLWQDPAYSTLSLLTPDSVEKKLMQIVKEGRAEPALNWYSRLNLSFQI